jgi:hypothetical protein
LSHDSRPIQSADLLEPGRCGGRNCRLGVDFIPLLSSGCIDRKECVIEDGELVSGSSTISSADFGVIAAL